MNKRKKFTMLGLLIVISIGFTWAVYPKLIGPSAAEAIPERRLHFTCTHQTCQEVTTDSSVTNYKAFAEGESDLTGDGVPEQIRKIGEKVCIFQNAGEVWCSPPEWQILDLALGDPNDDGREEILLAFWKDDAQGIPRSHPFIMGYREGLYRTIWGGSPVSEPIYEVALGDMDGDGTQELVVIDAAEETGRTISVWHWYGWGFSLIWRSKVGDYRELVLTPGENDKPAVITVKITR